MPGPTFGLCNQREPADIDKLNFHRPLKGLAFGNYPRFQASVVRLHRWKLSAVNHEKYLQSKIAKASEEFDFHTLATEILHRAINIEHFLPCRHKYQSAIGDCRAKWLGNAQTRRKNRKKARAAYGIARRDILRAGLIKNSQYPEVLALEWAKSPISLVLESIRKPIAADNRLVDLVVDAVAPMALGIIAPELTAEQVRAIEKRIVKDIAAFCHCPRLDVLIERSNLIRRTCINKCKEKEFVHPICTALGNVILDRDDLRRRAVAKLLGFIDLYKDDPNACFQLYDLIEILGQHGYDSPIVADLLLDFSREKDPDDQATALQAMSCMKVKRKELVMRALEIFDDFHEPNTDYGDKHSVLTVFDANRQFAHLALPVLAKSKSEDVAYLVQRWQKQGIA